MEQTIALIGTYGYPILFLLTVVEGPIITVVAGFLISVGVLNPFLTYVIVVTGDLGGDILHYFAGRVWHRLPWVARVGRFLGYSQEREEKLLRHFERHTGKTLLIGKLAHGVGGIFLVAAGMARVKWLHFLSWNILGTLPKSLLLLLIGVYAGKSYLEIQKYLGYATYVSIGITVLLVAIYVISRRVATKVELN